ncbi:MAG: hypothetical protein Kow0029_26900 [Candidatus Rifleibacteriota bacterium]
MDINSLEKLIISGKITKPVFVFAGPEEFLKERMFQKLVARIVPPEDQKDNVFRIDCSGKEAENSFELIFSFAFNSSPRFFLFHSFNSLSSGKRKTLLRQISQGGVPVDTFLIFTTTDAKVAGEVTTAFKQQSEKVDFWQPFENQLPAWIMKETTELGGKITTEAAELLLTMAGSNLAVLFQEINKLVIGAKSKIIDAAMVRNSVRYLNQDSVFDFLNHFGNRRPKESIRALEVMINSGEAPQKIWFMLVKQLRDFRLLHELNKDRPDLFSEIFELLKAYAKLSNRSDYQANQKKKSIVTRIQELSDQMPPKIKECSGLGAANKIKNLYMAINFSYSDLVKLWPTLINIDLKLKSGAPDPKGTLQNFVASFLAGNVLKP